MRRIVLLTGIISLCFAAPAFAAGRVVTASEGAASRYLRAAGNGFEVQSPGESDVEFPDYPPYPPQWHQMAKAAREANRNRLALARSARGLEANWPAGEDRSYLNGFRALATQLGDAALYEHVQGNDAEAVELVRDVLALGHSLRSRKDSFIVDLLIASGIEAVGCNRLLVIAADQPVGADAAAARKLVPSGLIDELLAQRDVRAELTAALGRERVPPGTKPFDFGGALQILNHAHAEHGMVAMSLACHLCRAEKGHWPASAAELAPAFLPKLPLDPFGDGKQTLGYVLIKGSLPDRSDRPLVYSRGDSPDGLLYRLDQPLFYLYKGDGSSRPPAQQKHGGQFRDVTLWKPVKLPPDAPTTAVLEPPKASALPF